MLKIVDVKVLVGVNEKVLRLFDWIARVVGLLPLFFNITEKWTFKRDADSKMSFPFIKRREHRSFQILQYHRINDEENQIFPGVPVKVFENQMAGIKEFFNVYALEELVERVFRENIPPRAVAITFDDGYKDFYDNAFPILKGLELPSTVFLTTGPIESQRPLWHDRVFYAFQKSDAPMVSIEMREYRLRTLEEKNLAVFAFRQYLRNYEYRRWDSLIDQLCGDLGVTSINCQRTAEKLKWSQIEEMSKCNISFGAHTVTHPILTNLDLSEAMDEVLSSRNTIEKILNAPVRLFAYPNGNRGDFNEFLKNAIKDAGFLAAVTTLWGSNDFRTDPFELRRVGTWGRNALVSAMRLSWQKFLS